MLWGKDFSIGIQMFQIIRWFETTKMRYIEISQQLQGLQQHQIRMENDAFSQAISKAVSVFLAFST